MALVVIPLSRFAPDDRGAASACASPARSGSALMATGFLVLSTLGTGSSYWHFLAGLLPFGAGMALAGAPATTAIVASLPREKQGVASAVNDVSRELGGALGIAVLGSVLNTAYRVRRADAHGRRCRPALAEQRTRRRSAPRRQIGHRLGAPDLVAHANERVHPRHQPRAARQAPSCCSAAPCSSRSARPGRMESQMNATEGAARGAHPGADRLSRRNRRGATAE